MAQDSGIVAPELLAGVRMLLKSNPKGMSVSDIAAGLGMNRNSTAKYLDILSVGGQIEMRAFGPAKVYFLSQRVPLGAILNYTTEYILIVDQHYRILQVNDRFLEFLGMDRADLLGASIDTVRLPIVSAHEVRSRMLEARSEGEVSLELETGEGEASRYYRVRLISTAFDDGSTGLTCIIEEITARKQAERALRERERRFREIVELSPFPCAIVDAGGVYLYVNTRFSETFGYTAGEIGTIDRWFELAYPDPDYRSHMAAEWDREVESGVTPEPRFFHIRTRSGEVREVVFRRRRLSDGNHYLTYEDISDSGGSRTRSPNGTGSTTRSTARSGGSRRSRRPGTTTSSPPGSTGASPTPPRSSSGSRAGVRPGSWACRSPSSSRAPAWTSAPRSSTGSRPELPLRRGDPRAPVGRHDGHPDREFRAVPRQFGRGDGARRPPPPPLGSERLGARWRPPTRRGVRFFPVRYDYCPRPPTSMFTDEETFSLIF